MGRQVDRVRGQRLRNALTRKMRRKFDVVLAPNGARQAKRTDVCAPPSPTAHIVVCAPCLSYHSAVLRIRTVVIASALLVAACGDQEPSSAGTEKSTASPPSEATPTPGVVDSGDDCESILPARLASEQLGEPLLVRDLERSGDVDWDRACHYRRADHPDDESGDPLGIYFFETAGDGIERLATQAEEASESLLEVGGAPALISAGPSYTYVTAATPNLVIQLEVDGPANHDALARLLTGLVLDSIGA